MDSAERMRLLEEAAEKKGISRLQLMENAGRESARVISQRFGLSGKRVLVVCYHGNNGGDGFAAARYLAQEAEVDILFIGEEAKLKPEAQNQFEKAEKDEHIQFISLAFVEFDQYDMIVDALLGLGSSGELRYPVSAAVDLINSSSGIKVSLDIPTGMDPDTGEGVSAIKPDLVITFHEMKPCLSQIKD